MYAQKKLTYIINLIGLCTSLELFLFGLFFENSNMLFFATIMIVAVAVFYSITDLRNRIVLLFYAVSFTTFLLSKPFINLFLDPDGNNIYFKPLSIIYLAMLCVLFGVRLGKRRSDTSVNDLRTVNNKIEIVSALSKIVYYSTIIFSWAVTLEKIILVRNFGYIGLYTEYNSVLPAVIHKLSVINETSFFIYLMTFPSNKNIYISFVVYCFGLFLKLLTGVRGDTMIGVMLLATYVIFRNKVADKPIFSGRKVKVIFVILAVLLISYMGIYSSIRLGEKGGGFLDGLGQFFSQQGGTINVLKNSIDHAAQLKTANKNYTFSPIANYNLITRWISSSLFSFDVDGSKLHSGYLGNNLTYILDPAYFNYGGSFGTSYLAEVFVDYSYIGVIIYNLFLGYLLNKLTNIKLSNWAVGAYCLYVIKSLYFLPRDSAFSFITPILSMSNLLLILVIKFLSDALYRRKRKKYSENTLDAQHNS